MNRHSRILTCLQCDSYLPSVLASTVPQDKLFALASGCGSWAQSRSLELSPLPEDVHLLHLYKSFCFMIACLLGSHSCFPGKKGRGYGVLCSNRGVGNRPKSSALNSQTGLSWGRDLWTHAHLECSRSPPPLVPPCLLLCYDRLTSQPLVLCDTWGTVCPGDILWSPTWSSALLSHCVPCSQSYLMTLNNPGWLWPLWMT